MRSMATKISVAVVVVFAASLASPASAQQQIPSCASKLIPCASYLNSTAPPASCCGPMKEAVKTEMPCLCGLFNNTALLKTFNIDRAQVLRLPKACGIDATASSCGSKATVTPPAAGNLLAGTPPATPAGNSSNSAHGAAWIGMSGLVGVYLFIWSITA